MSKLWPSFGVSDGVQLHLKLKTLAKLIITSTKNNNNKKTATTYSKLEFMQNGQGNENINSNCTKKKKIKNEKRKLFS